MLPDLYRFGILNLPHGKTPLLTVCVVAAVAFLLMAESKSDEPAKAPGSRRRSYAPGKRPAGEVRNDNSLKMKLVWCPPGVPHDGTG